jgi:hypothetical protein
VYIRARREAIKYLSVGAMSREKTAANPSARDHCAYRLIGLAWATDPALAGAIIGGFEGNMVLQLAQRAPWRSLQSNPHSHVPARGGCWGCP